MEIPELIWEVTALSYMHLQVFSLGMIPASVALSWRLNGDKRAKCKGKKNLYIFKNIRIRVKDTRRRVVLPGVRLCFHLPEEWLK